MKTIFENHCKRFWHDQWLNVVLISDWPFSKFLFNAVFSIKQTGFGTNLNTQADFVNSDFICSVKWKHSNKVWSSLLQNKIFQIWSRCIVRLNWLMSGWVTILMVCLWQSCSGYVSNWSFTNCNGKVATPPKLSWIILKNL